MRLTVRVAPGARVTEVGGRWGDVEPPVLMVRVRAPAAAGRANDAVVRALAEAFSVPRGEVRIVSGHSARTKLVQVDGGDPATLAGLLRL